MVSGIPPRQHNTIASQEDQLPRMLIVDDDPVYGSHLAQVASKKGFQSRYFPSLLEMGSFALIKEYDVAVIDYYLGNLRGDEIAEYVDTFFAQVPVVIISVEDLNLNRTIKWPASVRSFVPKSAGPIQIVDTARKILEREKMLRYFEAGPAHGTKGQDT